MPEADRALTRVWPIDATLPQLVAALRQHSCVILEAPPGTGKTTRIPWALLGDDAFAGGRIWVLEPRRIAARMAARWVASRAGSVVGEEIGYCVRYENKAGPDTRLVYLTEGAALQRMLDRQAWTDLALVILDEFHERNLDGDVALALLRQAQEELGAAVKILVMSATLDGSPLAAHLGDCPVIRVQHEAYPVEVSLAPRIDRRPLEVRVRSALAAGLKQYHEGDVLIFLPGFSEIRRCMDACRNLAEAHGVKIFPLHGTLSTAQQDAAVRPSSSRRVIFSTNVAETSITIEGVRTVIDSGLVRVAYFDPRSGTSRLRLETVTQASALQRRGRAGRVGPGACTHLFTEREFRSRPKQGVPEIARSDLSDLLLQLATSGHAIMNLPWLDAPPRAHLEAARSLLQTVGALNNEAEITEVGRLISKMPTGVRWARVLLEAWRLGIPREGALAVSLMEARDLRSMVAEEMMVEADTTSDVLSLLELYTQIHQRRSECKSRGHAQTVLDGVRRISEQLQERMRRFWGSAGAPTYETEVALRIALMSGFSDRFASVVEPIRGSGGDLLLCTGQRVRLSERSAVRDQPWVVVVQMEERSSAGSRSRWAHSVSGIELDWMLDYYSEGLVEETELDWRDPPGRIEQSTMMRYGALVIDESRRPATPSSEASKLLQQKVWEAWPNNLFEPGALATLEARLACIRDHAAVLKVPDLNEPMLKDFIAQLCEGAVALEELRERDPMALLLLFLGADMGRELQRLVPTKLTLDNGRRLPVFYELGKPPWMESWLQDFFGLEQGPRVLEGRLPLTLHLLAPNRRAVQVSTDLASFWDIHYPELRRSLSRRYPRHAWPDEPRTATPPPRGGGRRRA